MAHLKSRDQHIPGGFRFFQAQTSWRAPEWQSFATVVNAVVKHRLGNPFLQTQFGLSIDPDAVAFEVDQFNAAICKANGWNDFIVEDDSPKPFPQRTYQPVAVAVAENVRKTAIGVGALKDWIGDGLKPVDRTTAENRAVICVNCPHNTDDPNWIQKLDAAAAKLTMGLIEAKNKMQLLTGQDSKLGTCAVCDCYLRLKVWSPSDIVQKNTPADIREKLPSFCWVKTESGAVPS